jgi:predicted metalloprotease
MKINPVAALLSVLIIVVLAGCAQTAAVSAVPKTTVPAPEQNTTPQVVSTNQSLNDTKTSENATTSSPSAANTENEITKISDILGNPKTYGGRIVTVKGKIVTECGSGCWFTLQDGNAVIYIDLAPNNMVIPQKKGSTARVTGEIIREGSDVYMVGSKVDF